MACKFLLMPSRAAHRAALRRSSEPSVILPTGLVQPPLLPMDMGWRNPVRGYDYIRNEWHAYIVLPDASYSYACVWLLEDRSFEVRSNGSYARVRDPRAAFELAAAWAINVLEGRNKPPI